MRHLLIPVVGSEREEYTRWTVILPRFRCNSCGHTHVDFPEDGIIPYKHYGERDIDFKNMFMDMVSPVSQNRLEGEMDPHLGYGRNGSKNSNMRSTALFPALQP